MPIIGYESEKYEPSQALMGRWYDLISELPSALGAAMLHWSENAQGHPFDVTYEEWTETIAKHAEALLRIGRDEHQFGDIHEDTISEAKEALYWVADNLTRMWD